MPHLVWLEYSDVNRAIGMLQGAWLGHNEDVSNRHFQSLVQVPEVWKWESNAWWRQTVGHNTESRPVLDPGCPQKSFHACSQSIKWPSGGNRGVSVQSDCKETTSRCWLRPQKTTNGHWISGELCSSQMSPGSAWTSCEVVWRSGVALGKEIWSKML